MADVETRGTAGSPEVAVAVSGLAIAVLVMFAAVGVDGPVWLLVAVLGAVGAWLGWRTRGGARPEGKSLVAVVLGGLAVLSVIAWIVVAAATGNL